MSLRHCVWVFCFSWLLVGVGCTFKVPTYGLRPVYPENRNRGGLFDGYESVFLKVDSLQPTLRWEPFPRSHDIRRDHQNLLSRIRDVTYDLKIWNSTYEFPDRVIYTRQGLLEPFHKIEQPLEPCAKYFWTVRARFKIDGETRVTEWGISEVPRGQEVRKSSIIPNPNLYRFRTPCLKTSTDKKQTESHTGK